MKKNLFLIVTLLCLIFQSSGLRAEDSMLIGYIEAGTESTGSIVCESNDAEVSAAVFLPKTMLDRFAGCSITAVRTFLQSRLNIDCMDVWIRESLEGENLASGTLLRGQDPDILKGQNECLLSQEYSISTDDGEGVYLGVTYHQTGTTMGIAYTEGGSEGEGFLKLPGGEWQNVSDQYSFFIEGVVSGENLPKDVLGFDNVDFSPYFELETGGYRIRGTVRNLGVNDVNKFGIKIQLQDCQTPFFEQFDCLISYGETYAFESVIMPEINESEGLRTVKVSFTSVNGNEIDEDTSPSVSGNYQIVKYAMIRKVLVEEFTTQSCVNCPRVAQWMHEMLSDPHFRDIVVPVCHHSGFGTDNFTIPSDEEYLWFYGSKNVYAPALMIDRTLMTGTSLTFNPDSRKTMETLVDVAAGVPALIAVSLSCEIKDDKIMVIVRGEKSSEAEFDNPRIVVALTEDNIAGRQTGGDDNYRHQHVSRAVSSTWGEPVSFLGDEYEYKTELPLSVVRNAENMNVVAYIYNYDPHNVRNCNVLNSAVLSYEMMTETAVGEIDADEEYETEWYDLSGLRYPDKPDQNGIYIERRGGKAKKLIIN